MSEQPIKLADVAASLIEWNDKAAAWLKKARDYWDDGTDECDREFDQVSISFERSQLDLFMKNQEDAAKWLRLVALFIAEKEAA